MYVTMYLFPVGSICTEQRLIHDVRVKSLLKVSNSQFL